MLTVDRKLVRVFCLLIFLVEVVELCEIYHFVQFALPFFFIFVS